jgi:diphthine synthase
MIGFVSAGFNPPSSLTMEEIDFLDASDKIIVDTFTSPFYLKNYKNRDLIFADREKLENYEWIFQLEGRIAIIISGDSFSATTHFNIYSEAVKRGLEVKAFHNATIVPLAATRLGLQLYKIGPVVSLPRFSEKFRPISPYEKIKRNKEMKLHTIILLDISPPMTLNEALEELLWMEREMKEKLFTSTTKIGIISCLGMPEETIKFSTIEKLASESGFKPPLTIVLPGDLHFQEEENLSIFDF